MKTMKVALLATAALAAVSVSARADESAAIKAQLEALTARIAQLEAAPSVPAGYQLLTVSNQKSIIVPGLDFDRQRERSANALTIGIVPAADMPASTLIQWEGSVRAALTYRDVSLDSGDESEDYPEGDQMHIKSRGRLTVTGTTDTAVGEVGATMSIFGDFDATGSADTFNMDSAWGWWKMTPELTFAGGYNGSLASIGLGIAAVNDTYVTRGDTHVQGGDMQQLRLSYASGPLGIAIALEHSDEDGNAFSGSADTAGSPFGVAGEVTYSNDSLGFEIAGFIRDDEDVTQSQIGAGVNFALSDMVAISAAGSLGNDVGFTDADGNSEIGDGWEVSAAAVATLTDSVSAEIGAGMSSYEGKYSADDDTDVTAVTGGIFWSPVSQLKMGGLASWQHREDDNDDLTDVRAAFVTWWNFSN